VVTVHFEQVPIEAVMKGITSGNIWLDPHDRALSAKACKSRERSGQFGKDAKEHRRELERLVRTADAAIKKSRELRARGKHRPG